MSCTIKTVKGSQWTDLPSQEIRTLVDPNGDFALGNGLDGSVALEDNKPVAARLSDGVPPVIQYAHGTWDPSCGDRNTTSFKLDPHNTAGSLVLRADGTGIGISDIRDNGLQVIYIDLGGGPIVLDRQGNEIILKFIKNPKYFFISPTFPITGDLG